MDNQWCESMTPEHVVLWRELDHVLCVKLVKESLLKSLLSLQEKANCKYNIILKCVHVNGFAIENR